MPSTESNSQPFIATEAYKKAIDFQWPPLQLYIHKGAVAVVWPTAIAITIALVYEGGAFIGQAPFHLTIISTLLTLATKTLFTRYDYNKIFQQINCFSNAVSFSVCVMYWPFVFRREHLGTNKPLVLFATSVLHAILPAANVLHHFAFSLPHQPIIQCYPKPSINPKILLFYSAFTATYAGWTAVYTSAIADHGLYHGYIDWNNRPWGTTAFMLAALGVACFFNSVSPLLSRLVIKKYANPRQQSFFNAYKHPSSHQSDDDYKLEVVVEEHEGPALSNA